VDVYLLWHVGHARNLDGTPTRHFDEDGRLDWNEQDGDDVKLLGVYSTRQLAEERIRSARELPGFCDDPDCFLVSNYQVDVNHWSDGYSRYPGSNRDPKSSR
jgi:hypothetical protein